MTNDQTLRQTVTTQLYKPILGIALLIAVALFGGIRPITAEQTPTALETMIADSRVNEFVLHNGRVYYTRLYPGDGGGACTAQVRRGTIATGFVSTRVENNDCDGFLHLTKDNTALYYWSEHDNRLERRLWDNFNSPLLLSSFGEAAGPNAIAAEDETTVDGWLYLAGRDDIIRRIDKYGNNLQIVTLTDGEPRDIDVDDFYIWYVTPDGVWRMARDCEIQCSATRVNTDSAEIVLGASSPTGSPSVFWVTISNPPRIESYDCNIPNTNGCFHKDLYTTAQTNNLIGSIFVTDEHVWWLEWISAAAETRLRRVARAGGTAQNMATNVQAGSVIDIAAGLYADDTHIFLPHGGIGRIELDASPINFNFFLDEMMVTQGVQNLDNDMTLTAQKTTYVQVYGRQFAGPETGLVEAELAATRNGQPLPGSPIYALGTPADVDAAGAPRLDDLERWTFEIPYEWTTSGGTTLDVTLDPRGIYDPTPTSLARTVSFTNYPPVCLVAIPVRTHGPKARWTSDDYTFAINSAKKLLPLHDIWRYHQASDLAEGDGFFVKFNPYELPSDKTKVLNNIWWRDQFSDDPDECSGRTLYLGLVDPRINTGTLNGVAYRDMDQLWVKLPEAQNAWGFGYWGWPIERREATLAHEIGHNFNRRHIDCGNPAEPDPFFPYTNPNQCRLGYYTGRTTYYGYEQSWDDILIAPDLGTTADQAGVRDLMAYGAPRWTSDYTWEIIQAELDNRRSSGRGTLAGASEVVQFSGEVFGRTGTLNHGWRMPTSAMSRQMIDKWEASAATTYTPVRGAENYHLQFVGFNNTIVADYNITPIVAEDSEGAPNFFGLTVPVPQTTALSVRLMADDVILDSQSTLFVPELTIHEPSGGEAVTDEISLDWTATVASGALHFMVQISPDNGDSWYAVATDLIADPDIESYQLDLDMAHVPASNGQTALVRILASNGYNTAIATSQPFTIHNHRPTTFIDSPANGAIYPAGATIALEGAANDAEEGTMLGGDLAWQVDGAAHGTGSLQSADGLAPGAHTITLNATDNNGLVGSKSVTVDVAPVVIAEGTALLDGRCYDADYANGDVVTLKPYSDGTRATVTFLRNDDYFWACFSGLKDQGASSPGAFAGIRVDPNNSRDVWAQTSDYAFMVYEETGDTFVRVGNGAGGFSDQALELIASAFTARTYDSGSTWNAELRLDLNWMRDVGWGDAVGFDVAHYWVDFQGNDYHWPHAAAYNRPNTWAASHLRRTPILQTMSPLTATVPSGFALYTLTLEGENFADGDTAHWDGGALTTVYNSSNQLTTYIGNVGLTAGTHELVVESGESADVHSNPLTFTVYNPIPTTTAITPIDGRATAITVDGSDFVSDARIYFDGTPLATTFANSSRLTATVPDSLLQYDEAVEVRVANPEPSQGMSNPQTFYVGGVPTAVTLNHTTVATNFLPTIFFMLTILLGFVTFQAVYWTDDRF